MYQLEATIWRCRKRSGGRLFHLSSSEAPSSPRKLFSYIFRKGDEGEFAKDVVVEDGDRGKG